MKKSKDIKRYVGLIQVKRKTYFCYLFFGRLIDNLNAPLLAIMIKNLLDAAQKGDNNQFIKSAYFAIPIMLLAIFTNRIHLLESLCMRDIMHALRLKMFEHLQNLPMNFFDTHHSGQSIHRVNNAVEDYKRALANIVPRFIYSIMAGVTAIVTILLMDWRIGIMMIVVGFLSVKVTTALSKPQRAIGKDIQINSTGLSAKLSDILAGFREIKMFRKGQTISERYVKQNGELYGHIVKRAKKSAIVQCSNEFFGFVINVVLVMVGVIMSVYGYVSIGTVVGIIGLQGRLSWVFTNFGRNWAALMGSVATVDIIYEILDEVKEPERYEMQSKESSAMIEFNDVSFCYGEDDCVIKDLSFHVKKGESVALTGESGSGKSTTAKLLLGFYPATSGVILVDGKSIGDYSLAQLRSKISYVPQNAFLFDGTITENIRYGRPDATDEDIIEAAKAANAHQFIINLKDGYNTLVGERGSQLSGGQRQRIAIARAIIKNAPILLLDEATSALDYESEQLIQEAFNRLMKNCTSLIIAHRESTIEHADKILQMEDGCCKVS
jgi:ABC-type multidrug transport system fused ATPase/permease subunit